LQHINTNRAIVGKCHRTTSSPGGVIV
jgi:hypothetical protein